MITEFTFNPHNFIPFLTLGMGVSYVYFNSKTSFSLSKLFFLLLFLVPLVLVIHSVGHSIDIGIGALIGFLTAKGKLSKLNPKTWLIDLWLRYRFANIKQKMEDDPRFNQSTENGQSSNDAEETRKRQEQARQQRERQRQQEQQQSNNESENRRSEQSYQQNQNNHQQSQSSNHKSPLDEAYELLRISPITQYAEAKRAFRKMASEYHSDRVNGVSEGVRKLAEEHMKKINVAWDLICKEKGWN